MVAREINSDLRAADARVSSVLVTEPERVRFDLDGRLVIGNDRSYAVSSGELLRFSSYLLSGLDRGLRQLGLVNGSGSPEDRAFGVSLLNATIRHVLPSRPPVRVYVDGDTAYFFVGRGERLTYTRFHELCSAAAPAGFEFHEVRRSDGRCEWAWRAGWAGIRMTYTCHGRLWADHFLSIPRRLVHRGRAGNLVWPAAIAVGDPRVGGYRATVSTTRLGATREFLAATFGDTHFAVLRDNCRMLDETHAFPGLAEWLGEQLSGRPFTGRLPCATGYDQLVETLVLARTFDPRRPLRDRRASWDFLTTPMEPIIQEIEDGKS